MWTKLCMFIGGTIGIWGGPVTWSVFKAAFVDRFFRREMREEKVMEFINLCQGGRSIRQYSSEFVTLYKYAPSLVSDRRDEMSRFAMGVSKDLQDECQSAIIYYH